MSPIVLLEDINDGADGWNGVVLGLRGDFVRSAIVKPVEGTDDLELLLGLAQLLRRELQFTVTSSGQRAEISDTADQRLLFRALHRVCRRNQVVITPFEY